MSIGDFRIFEGFADEVFILGFKDYGGLVFEMFKEKVICADVTNVVYFFAIFTSADVFIIILLPSLINDIFSFILSHLKLVLTHG